MKPEMNRYDYPSYKRPSQLGIGVGSIFYHKIGRNVLSITLTEQSLNGNWQYKIDKLGYKLYLSQMANMTVTGELPLLFLKHHCSREPIILV